MPNPWANFMLWPNHMIAADITNTLFSKLAIEYETVETDPRMVKESRFWQKCENPFNVTRTRSFVGVPPLIKWYPPVVITSQPSVTSQIGSVPTNPTQAHQKMIVTLSKLFSPPEWL